jgi:methionyl-tRNA formyltransferase
VRVVLFGGKNRGTAILRKLIELNEEVVAVFYFTEDAHEKIWYQKVQDVAKEKGIPTYDIKATDKSSVTGILQKLKPDVIFCVSWRYKLHREQYSIPSKGCICFHDSLLPKYRGFAPMNWAIINGEERTGVTMFYIADDIDSGDIIGQKAVNIGIMDNAKTIDEKLTPLYIELLIENFPLIALKKAKRLAQDHTQATMTCKRIPEDGLINWSQSSYQIYNLTRGLTDPYPGAFTFLRDTSGVRKIYIWKASLDDEKKLYSGRIPGRIVEILKGKGVKILTGDGTLIIEDISQENQPEKIKADKIIKSVKATLGTFSFTT